MTIEELRNAAAAINDAADWLSRQFSGEPAVAEPAPAKEPRCLPQMRRRYCG